MGLGLVSGLGFFVFGCFLGLKAALKAGLKASLKAPSSYKFGQVLSSSSNGSNGVDVRFSFTAVNSFNAPLQYVGTCSTSKDADGKWNLNYGIER